MLLTAQVTPFPISDLFPDDMSEYYRYIGSLTSPPCQEIVVVRKEVILLGSCYVAVDGDGQA